MKHFRVFVGLLTLIMVLVACQGNASPTPLPVKASTTIPTVAKVTSQPQTTVQTTVSVATLSASPTHQQLGADDHILGPEKAYLTIAFYADFQCAACVDVARSLVVLHDRYPDDVRIIFRHFPQPSNDKARLAAFASEAAADQNKFWELHDLLFAEQSRWSALPPDQFRAKLDDYAKLIGIPDLKKFDTAIDSGQYAALIDAAYQEAALLDFKGVPVLLFNGLPYSGRIDEYALDNFVRLRLLEKRWYKQAPPMQIDKNKQYVATLQTDYGTVEIELNAKAAPIAVNNFVFLARQGWYDNITFHLVTPYLVQTGDPSGSGFGTAGYTITDEFNNGFLFDKPGVVAMANSSIQGVPNSSSSQFFVALVPLQPAEYYNNHYTIFGHVTKGLDILQKLRARNPFDDAANLNPPPGDKLISVKIAEK